MSEFEPRQESEKKVDCVETDFGYLLRCGGKEIELRFGENTEQVSGLSAETRIENIESKPEDGTTTILYNEIYKLIQTTADTKGKQIYYKFKTIFPSMANWALSKGEDIFHWDFTSTDTSNLTVANDFIAVKIFKPQPDQGDQ